MLDSMDKIARMRRMLLRLAGLVLVVGLSAPAWALGLDPAFPEPTLGPTQARGVVVWSHGRSINAEDSQTRTPAYLRALRDDGWDVMRFDRLRQGDTLSDSTGRLVAYATELKLKGYRQIVLAGQSFGGFLSLMAAGSASEVDAVIATAPAAYGSADRFPERWRLNATKLYPLLEQVRRARIMVFYFQGDAFDPGGRGERSHDILVRRGLGYAIVDQPDFFSGHWAASSGAFLRRYGSCIRDFADDESLSGELVCAPRWGTMPSAELKLPPDLTHPPASRGTVAAPAGSGASAGAGTEPLGVGDVWYGFYPNGREVLLEIETVFGSDLTAVYAIGPSIDGQYPAAWSRREGRIVEDGFVFEEPGKTTLRFRPRQDGGLNATWIAVDGKSSLAAHLTPIDPRSLARRDGASDRANASAPIPAAAAHGDGHDAEN